MTKISSLRPIIGEVENYFSILNRKFYEVNGESLETPIITVAPHSGKIVSMGECTTMRVWMDTETQSTNEGSYEIKISAHTLEYPKEVIFETLLHEMAHLYNLLHGIKDTNANGTYHNRRYKKTAEAHGLIVEKDENGKYGWCKTSLNDEAKSLIASSANDTFDIFRPIVRKTNLKKSSKSSSRKYVCPECGQIVRATKEVHIFCADCPSHPLLEWELPFSTSYDNATIQNEDEKAFAESMFDNVVNQKAAEPYTYIPEQGKE